MLLTSLDGGEGDGTATCAMWLFTCEVHQYASCQCCTCQLHNAVTLYLPV